MPTPKPAPGGFFTDRSPPVISKADQDFKAVVGRYPKGRETELAPRTGHPLEQVVDWTDCPLAKAYPQWEKHLFELSKDPLFKGRTARKDPRLGPDGPTAAQIHRKFDTCERKCEEL